MFRRQAGVLTSSKGVKGWGRGKTKDVCMEDDLGGNVHFIDGCRANALLGMELDNKAGTGLEHDPRL